MKMSWRAIFEQYVYTTLDEKMEHREEMLNKGYTDCGVVSSNRIQTEHIKDTQQENIEGIYLKKSNSSEMLFFRLITRVKI